MIHTLFGRQQTYKGTAAPHDGSTSDLAGRMGDMHPACDDVRNIIIGEKTGLHGKRSRYLKISRRWKFNVAKPNPTVLL
jgi:hypothetical protein